LIVFFLLTLNKVTYVAAIVKIKTPQFHRVLQSESKLLTINTYAGDLLPVLITNKNNECFTNWDENREKLLKMIIQNDKIKTILLTMSIKKVY
jgi:hypothetical protein